MAGFDTDVEDSPAQAPPVTSPSPSAAPPAAPAAAAPANGAPAPAVSTVAGPSVVQPVRRGGLAGIVDQFRDAIAGTTSSKVFEDSDGNKYIKHPQLSHGQQWLRIAATAASGAAAGEVAGQGRGGGAAAGARGFVAGQQVEQQQQDRQRQQEQDQNEEVKQAQLAKFNAVKLKHDVVANEFDLQRKQVEANQHDVQFSQEQIDREHKLGSADLGVFKDEADLARVKQQSPEFWKHVYDNNVVAVPELNEKGERTGVHLFLRTPGIGSQPVEPGTSIKIYTPGKGPADPPTLTEQVPTVPMTHDMVDAYNNAATTRYQQYFKDKSDRESETAKTAHTQAETTEVNAQARKANADTVKTQAETGKIKAETPKTAAQTKGLTGEEYLKALPSDQAALVRDVGTGRAAPERIAQLLSRGQSKQSQQLLAQVAQAYPDLDTSKLAAYPKVYQDFTSGKTSTALNSGATALVHLHELQQLNTAASHIPHTAAWTAYQNKAETVSSELAKFYGDATVPAIRGIKDTLTSTLPGNRDAAITTQSKSMGAKFDSYEQQWKNAAPSDSYQAKMPGMSLNAKQARAALDSDYAQRITPPTGSRPISRGNAVVGYVGTDGKRVDF